MAQSIAETQFLVIGAGPAGAGLAAFLGQNGLQGIVLSNAPGTADTPRAHLVNPFAMECLRDLDIEEDAESLATKGQSLTNMRWAATLAGPEYGRLRVWGGAANHARYVTEVTPCNYVDLPQSKLEPLLVRAASVMGFPVRFNTELIDVKETGSGYLCTAKDLTSQLTYQIRTTYLFGADGARSTVARSLNLDFQSEPSQGTAVNILFKADLSHIVRGKEAQLHWIMRAEKVSKYGQSFAIRMVHPTKEWMLMAPRTAAQGRSPDWSHEEIISLIHEVIGDDTIDINIVKVDRWTVRETIATTYSYGKSEHGDTAFILGDAAHRHPPAHGLGSNTCIQDAYNLAWKVAYVSKGWAGKGLLNSFTLERQPIGAALVRVANVSVKQNFNVSRAFGVGATTEEAAKLISELFEASEAGTSRRKVALEAIENLKTEGEGIGMAMNHTYVSSAVYTEDEDGPAPELKGDDFFLQPLVTTYPGFRLPHAYVDGLKHQKRFSTHDLAGDASFTVFYSTTGKAWADAADRISRRTGIPIQARGIGFGLEYHDVYRDWQKRNEVQEDGCVLVRPDRFVAWRAKAMEPDCEGKLAKVLGAVLDRPDLQEKQ